MARIAALLGVPVSDFFGPASSALAKGAELTRLWNAIPDDAGRDRLMALARELATGSATRPAVPDKLAAE